VVDVWKSERVLFVEFDGPTPHTLMASVLDVGGVVVNKLAILQPGAAAAWGVGAVMLFLADWVPRKVALDAEQRAVLPEALRRWLRFVLCVVPPASPEPVPSLRTRR
jgi:hypothetical protein